MLSIVIPAYNEEAGISNFHNDILMPSLTKLSEDSSEIIYVNDGSTDNTLDQLHMLTGTVHKNQRVKIVNLSKNFGKEIAVTAGISQAMGDAIIIMDADGQHPPELIGEFVAKWKDGYQIVVGVRKSNQNEGFIKRWGSKMFYQLFNHLSGTTIIPRSTDYRLIDRAVRKEFLRCTERQRISRGIIDWLGFHRDYVYFDSPARLAGEASYSTKKLIQLAVNSFVSLTLKPLIMLAWLGIIITLLAFVAGLTIFLEQFILGDPLKLHFTGSALLGIFITFLVGLVLSSQGVMAIYISHIYEQTQGRPLFIIDQSGSRNLP